MRLYRLCYYVLFMLLLIPVFACASNYVWKDQAGQLYFSDQPPLDPDAVTLIEAPFPIKPPAEKPPETIVEEKKKLLRWRCKELYEQYENAKKKAAENLTRAASWKNEAENYQATINRLCQ